MIIRIFYYLLVAVHLNFLLKTSKSETFYNLDDTFYSLGHYSFHNTANDSTKYSNNGIYNNGIYSQGP